MYLSVFLRNCFLWDIAKSDLEPTGSEWWNLVSRLVKGDCPVPLLWLPSSWSLMDRSKKCY